MTKTATFEIQVALVADDGRMDAESYPQYWDRITALLTKHVTQSLKSNSQIKVTHMRTPLGFGECSR